MKSFKQFNEVAPPGFGHTKGDKEKGVKKGGTAAAFDRARKRGDFKGSKSDMFAIMWSQKNKGDKPHYKPGTNKKYKKYQEEETSMPKKVEKSKGRHPRDQKELERAQEYIKKHPKFGVGEDWKPEIEHVKGSDLRKKAAEKKRKEAEKSLPPHLKLDVMRKAFASEAVKGQDTESRKEGAKERATEKKAHASWKPGTKKRPLYSTTRHTKGDAESYATQQKQSIKWHDKRTKGKFIPGTTSESLGFTIDSGEHKKASKKAKIRNLAKGNTNPNEKAAAEKKAGGPKLIGEEEKCKCDCGQDPCIECGESHHKIEEGVRGAAIGAAVGGVVAGPLGAAAGAALGASSGTGKKRVAAYNKGREVVQSVKDKAKKIKQTLKGAQEKRRESVKSTMAKEETSMKDNNLFGNAYAGSKRQKKKAIDAIPNKSSEVYNRNWQHKTPDNARESVEIHDAKGNLYATVIDIIKPEPMKVPDSPVKWKELTETKLPSRNGNIIDCYLAWRGNNYMIKMFFPQSRTRKPTKSEVNTQLQKVYPGAKLWNYQISNYEPGAPLLQVD